MEKKLSEDSISSRLASLSHFLTLTVTCLVPIYTSGNNLDLDVLMVNLFFNIVYIVLALKCISYIFTNRRLREEMMTTNNNEESPYPSNLTAKNCFKFYMSPSLVYNPKQNNESDVINKRKIVLRSIELCSLLLLVRIPFLMMGQITKSLLVAAEDNSLLLVTDR